MDIFRGVVYGGESPGVGCVLCFVFFKTRGPARSSFGFYRLHSE